MKTKPSYELRTQQALQAYVAHHNAFLTWTDDPEEVVVELLVDLRHLVGDERFKQATERAERYFSEEEA